MAAQQELSVRGAMTKLIAVLNDVGDDVLSAEKEIVVAMQDLMSIPGLDTVATQSNTSADPRSVAQGRSGQREHSLAVLRLRVSARAGDDARGVRAEAAQPRVVEHLVGVP